MEINEFGYRCVDGGDIGPVFELMVDGRLLGKIIESLHTAIPSWLLKDGLPIYDPDEPETADPSWIIIAVCDCGVEYCGHTRCKVTADNDFVTFTDFKGDLLNAKGKNASFRFRRSNYDAELAHMVAKANEIVAAYQQKNAIEPQPQDRSAEGIYKLLKAGDKMSAIRLYRELYSANLKDAVEAIEKMDT